MAASKCIFCNPPGERVLREGLRVIALADGFPVSKGHTLVVPRRHVASLYDLEDVEIQAVWAMVTEVRTDLADRVQPDGFNIGLNDGQAAGQTIMHAHVHVIPRFRSDVADPRGGIRWVVPGKAAYWRDRKS